MMEKKIIKITKRKEEGVCLLCCENQATLKMEINRVKYDESVVSFYVCDECLAKMQNDIKVCE